MIEEIRKTFKQKLPKVLDLYGALEFGSAAKSVEDPGDYDLLVVANYDFVVPRRFYEDLGKIYSEVHGKYGVQIDFIVTDRRMPGTLFSTIARGFRNHLEKYSIQLAGEDVRGLFTSSRVENKNKLGDFQYEALDFLTWDLRRMRSNAVKINHAKSSDPSQFQNMLKTGIKLSTFCGNVAIFQGKAKEVGEGLEFFERYYDISKLSERKNSTNFAQILNDIKKDSKEPMNSEEKIALFFRALTFREQNLELLYKGGLSKYEIFTTLDN